MHDISNRKLQSQLSHLWNAVIFLTGKFVGKVVGELEHEKERL